MSNTPNLALPYLDQNQSQKYVTHNAAIRMLDALVAASVLDANLTIPPATPSDGDRHIVASGATGAWATKDFQIAAWQDGAWSFYPPRAGWQVYVIALGLVLTFDGSVWGYSVRSPHGASTGLRILEEEVTLAGSSSSSTIQIPNRAIVLGVSVRTTLAITGATAFNCGVAGNASQFGGSLGIALGSTNIGVIGPTAFYSPTPILLSAVGPAFTGGKVRVAIHFIDFTAATS
jgi:hypothetical protein